MVACGWSAMQTLRRQISLSICAHRPTLHHQRHGITTRVTAKVARLVGVDILHIAICSHPLRCEQRHDELKAVDQSVFTKQLGPLKGLFAAVSGGHHPGTLAKTIKQTGNDVMLLIAEGCHGHPQGTRAGAQACFQAVDAAMHSISFSKYAKLHKQLSTAQKHFER